VAFILVVVKLYHIDDQLFTTCSGKVVVIIIILFYKWQGLICLFSFVSTKENGTKRKNANTL